MSKRVEVKKKSNNLWPLAAVAGIGLLGREAYKRWREADLKGQVVLITGSSRGLGFLLAREFARQGCRLVITARDEAELARAKADLVSSGAEVLAIQCDITHPRQIDRLISEATNHYGCIDILVNNAGLIKVAPLHAMQFEDFTEAQQVMFWGVLYPILAVLPQMRARHYGRIVNITSIGGRISIPHLLPYSTAKFATVGLSEGLRGELAQDGIKVTTITPGLMRTGSHLNAYFKGDQAAEFTWFSLGATLPFISMDAERAARQIVRATRRGEADRTLSLPAQLATRFHGLFPGLTSDIAGLVNRFVLPQGRNATTATMRGMEIQAESQTPVLDALTTLGQTAAAKFNEHPGPVNVPSKAPQTGKESTSRHPTIQPIQPLSPAGETAAELGHS